LLTLKSARDGIRRSEFEYPIPKQDADQLLQLAQGAIIEKTRHELPAGDLVWEIDVFKGQNDGLVLAEIELDHSEQGFARPSWLGEEVTRDLRYYNSRLSKRPFQRW
jgi:adenylate cyclase